MKILKVYIRIEPNNIYSLINETRTKFHFKKNFHRISMQIKWGYLCKLHASQNIHKQDNYALENLSPRKIQHLNYHVIFKHLTNDFLAEQTKIN